MHVPHVAGQSIRELVSVQFAPLHVAKLSITPPHEPIVGDIVGLAVGSAVGEAVGADVVGDRVGDRVGDVVGDRVGVEVGVADGGAVPQLPHFPRQTASMSVMEHGKESRRQKIGSATVLKQ